MLYAYFHQLLALGPIISSTLSVFIVMTVSFVLNALFVFKRTITLKTYLKFLLVTATGIIIIQGIISELLEPVVRGFALNHLGNGTLEIFFANSLTRVTGTIFSLVWNFLFYKFVVFNIRRRETQFDDSDSLVQ